MSATRARDLVESHPHTRDSYKKLNPRMDGPDNDYMALLATIQVCLDRINVEKTGPGPIDMATLRQIAKFAIEASNIITKEPPP